MIQKSKVIGYGDYGDPYATVTREKHKCICEDCHREVGRYGHLHEDIRHNSEKGIYRIWICIDCENEIDNSFS
jgi:hypothetical protein